MEALSIMWALSVLNGILGSQPCDKAAMLDDNTIEEGLNGVVAFTVIG